MSLLKDIRHISFDAWNTLIIPNLEFSRARSELIAEVYDIPFEQAKAAYTQTKRFLDTAAELDGYGTSCSNVYKLLNAQLKGKLDDGHLTELRSDINELFAEFPPTLPDELAEVLIQMSDCGFTMNILSNTNYVGGNQLLTHVFDLKLGENFFEFTLFSDQHKVAKPHADFFNMMKIHANFVNEGYLRGALLTELGSHEILHVGDNRITDVKGANDNNITALYVRDPHHTAALLKEAMLHA